MVASGSTGRSAHLPGQHAPAHEQEVQDQVGQDEQAQRDGEREREPVGKVHFASDDALRLEDTVGRRADDRRDAADASAVADAEEDTERE
eukprot:4173264-Prymnesium_polylepis.1